MSQTLFNPGWVVTRLQQEVSALKRVAEASNQASAGEDIKSIMPAAYVLPLRDTAGPNILANAVSQDVTHIFAVVVVVRSLRDVTGAAARSELQPLREGIADVLLKWTPGPYVDDVHVPDDNFTPCEYVGGRLLDLNDKMMWWADEYRTRFEVRKT